MEQVLKTFLDFYDDLALILFHFLIEIVISLNFNRYLMKKDFL